jgi:mono/diheme cytochrome c family protein
MKFSIIAAVVVGLGASVSASAQDGRTLVESQCTTCHSITKPDNPGIDHLWERKGPDLYYAGSKFNQAWLETWLTDPVRIRPAGEFYTKHVKATDAEDAVDESTLKPHVKLSAADAKAAADYLMTLKAADGLVQTGAYKDKKVNARMGKMFFVKLRGCGACHADSADVSAASGPELYTAGERLQPDFIYSYIKNPQSFDAGIWMPLLPLSEPDLQRLTGYIVQLNAKGAAK